MADHQVGFPTISVCSHPGLKAPAANLSDSDKAYVEKRLSPMKTFPQMWSVWSKFVREVPFGATATAFNTFEEMFNNTTTIKALLQQMIIETSLMLTPLCNETIVSLKAGADSDQNIKGIKGQFIYEVRWQGERDSAKSDFIK